MTNRTPIAQASARRLIESLSPGMQHSLRPVRFIAYPLDHGGTTRSLVDAAVVYRRRRAHDWQRELRHDRDLPVPRLPGQRQSALAVVRIYTPAARARLRRPRRDGGARAEEQAIGTRRRPRLA